MRFSGGTAYGGWTPPPPSTVPPTSYLRLVGPLVPASHGSEYAAGYSDPTVVGALKLQWPLGVQAADWGVFVLLADLWGDAMYAKSERSITAAALAVPVPVRRDLPYLLLIRMWRRLKRRWTTWSDSDSAAVLSASSPSGDSPASPRGESAPCRNHNVRVRLRRFHTRIPTSDRGGREAGEAC